MRKENVEVGSVFGLGLQRHNAIEKEPPRLLPLAENARWRVEVWGNRGSIPPMLPTSKQLTFHMHRISEDRHNQCLTYKFATSFIGRPLHSPTSNATKNLLTALYAATVAVNSTTFVSPNAFFSRSVTASSTCTPIVI